MHARHFCRSNLILIEFCLFSEHDQDFLTLFIRGAIKGRIFYEKYPPLFNYLLHYPYEARFYDLNSTHPPPCSPIHPLVKRSQVGIYLRTAIIFSKPNIENKSVYSVHIKKVKVTGWDEAFVESGWKIHCLVSSFCCINICVNLWILFYFCIFSSLLFVGLDCELFTYPSLWRVYFVSPPPFLLIIKITTSAPPLNSFNLECVYLECCLSVLNNFFICSRHQNLY